MSKTRILIVEDEWLIGNDMQASLEQMGYDVIRVATTGEEAIKEVKLSQPDLVLMDIVLKGEMDGIKAAATIHSCYDVPVIYITAYSDKETLERAKITEPYGYITKPLKAREVSIIIEMALYKHKAEKRLKESEEWFSTTLQSIGDAVIALDTRGNVLFMNPCARSLTGCGEEVVGRQLKDIIKIINNKGEGDDNPVYKAINEGRPVGLKNHTLISKDGRRVPIGDSASPIKDNKGSITGVVLVFSDMTELKRLEEEREGCIRDLNEALQKVKTLKGLIPICAGCKKIRDDKGYWEQVEDYIRKRSDAEFTHGMCPECIMAYYPQLFDKGKAPDVD